MQVLQGLHRCDWHSVRQLAVEVHSKELLDQVQPIAHKHFAEVQVHQDKAMRSTELFLLLARRAG